MTDPATDMEEQAEPLQHTLHNFLITPLQAPPESGIDPDTSIASYIEEVLPQDTIRLNTILSPARIHGAQKDAYPSETEIEEAKDSVTELAGALQRITDHRMNARDMQLFNNAGHIIYGYGDIIERAMNAITKDDTYTEEQQQAAVKAMNPIMLRYNSFSYAFDARFASHHT